MVASITTTAKGPLHQPVISKQRLPSCGAGRTPSPTKMRKRTLKRCCGLSMQACRTFPGYSTITRECPSVNTVPHSVCIIKIRKPLFADRIRSLWEIQSNLAYTYVLLLEKRGNILNQNPFQYLFLRIQKFCKKRKRGGEVEQFAIQICVFPQEEVCEDFVMKHVESSAPSHLLERAHQPGLHTVHLHEAHSCRRNSCGSC